MNEEAILLPALKSAVIMTLAAMLALVVYALRHTGFREFNHRRWFFENRYRIALALVGIGIVTGLTILEPDTFKQLVAGGVVQVASAIGAGLLIGQAFITGLGTSR